MQAVKSIYLDESDIDPKIWGFRSGTINHQQQPDGGRRLEAYEAQLMIDRSELADKVVLDLGAGSELKLATGLKTAGIPAQVISISPDFAIKRHAVRAINSAPSEKGSFLAAVGQTLPFKDETFDVVLALHVEEHLPLFVTAIMFGEMARVLKKGGFAKMGPVSNVPHEKDYLEKLTEREPFSVLLMETLEKYGVQIAKEPVPEEVIPKQLIHDYDGYDKSWELSFNIVLTKAQT